MESSDTEQGDHELGFGTNFGANWMIVDGLARTTINQNIGRIRRMFRWAASEELIPATVYQSLSTMQGLQRGRTEAREPAPVLPVEDDRIDAALPFMPRIVADMARLQRLCGARPGEIVILRPCDMKRDGRVWKYTPESHKNEHRGKSRVIYLGPQAQEILRPYLDRRADAYCFSPARPKRNAAKPPTRPANPSERNRATYVTPSASAIRLGLVGESRG